ncbi:MAG: hypothetical protein JWO81_1721 [Alphaproteobacteria bacterium]|nr:hypothetical protein [Alphaproteobacteria bacterium]
MRDFITALISFIWALLLYCVQRIAKLLGGPGDLVDPKNPPPPGAVGPWPRSLTGLFYRSGRRLFERLSDPAAVLFLALDECLTKLAAWAFPLPPDSRRYRHETPNRLWHQLQLTYAGIGPQRRLSVQQAMNTRHIFILVRNNPDFLRIPKEGELDLAELIERAYQVSEFENIWRVEGLGHVYTQRTWSLKWDASDSAHGILTEGQAVCLPEKSLTMMHAGLGLGFAEALLKRVTPDTPVKEMERVLVTFLRLCRNNSRPGYLGCALESLGLVTRCFNFQVLSLVQTVLADLDPVAWEYFWRGAGRGTYFAPAHLIPPLYSPWVAADQEAPSDRVHEILKAAIAWPANIVNMQTPEIFLAFIRRYGAVPENRRAIAQGVAASTTMAADITPGHSVIKAYLEYVPDAEPEVQELWAMLVREPAAKAMHRYQPVLKRHAMMDQVFRYQDLDALVDQLDPLTPPVDGRAGVASGEDRSN